ncbi:Glutamine synthetase [Monocercomonoides exilis]|uniref:Glutamine synthetase n=1 Tax=Monocercomonoides exilis TaxID=2049356 RepID=UPI003559B894|nr:Glutamine synthetase [Monocercomonoides exilis]|eukprot:MONOS_1066.1-p1 / transcript=MONOS_1066.1 / gene=MONOS_1066 / organism=Monocercomonoides_exilis_PA203 / gene_product=Glutamine synthetase / transcript_product=Glutamine synthetase / location=Mono_scaffold00018:74535-75932(+) / protein_length=445 / sequence_SO=supercontig / SO=protein_coding / is_pseudo=false
MPRKTYSAEVEDLIAHQQEEIKTKNVRFLRCMFSSMCGTYHCMEENANLYSSICHNGVDVDGSSIGGFATLTNSDMTLFPDPKTLIFGQSEGEDYAEVICMAHSADGSVHPGDPRGILCRVVEKAKKMGFPQVLMFGELEFFLCKKEGLEPADTAGYCSVPPLDQGGKFRHELMHRFEKSGLKVKRIHHEGSPGQNEVELDFTEALENADAMTRGMQITREIAAEYGEICTYSPKPFPHLAGSGTHEHTILFDEKGENVFVGPHEGLSDIAHSFIAGLCKYGRDVTSVFALSDRTFKRLCPGFEAPIWTGWDIANRSALVRVPRINFASPGKTRIEFRAGDSSGSPYLLSAMILSAGLKGIEEKLVPNPRGCGFNFDSLTEEKAAEMKINRLPVSMEESKAQLAKESDYLKEVLTPHAIEFLKKFSYVEPEGEPFQPGKWRKMH